MASSHEIESQAMDERLTRLERQNRTMKRIGVSMLLIVGAVLLMGQTATRPKQQTVRMIEAEHFTLLDRNGRAAAVLGVFEGGPGLILVDDQGINRCGLAAIIG